mmetsp:Transcript_15132/g.26368  ORF Transcript_15132/g.26368 Transcript_15132/m.26368 type:complete len:242 (+) Transcript_15132:233-958(+)
MIILKLISIVIAKIAIAKITTTSTTSFIQLGHNWLYDLLHILQLALKVLRIGVRAILLQPVLGLLDRLLNRLLLICTDLATNLVLVFNLRLHAIQVILKRVLGFDLVFQRSVLLRKLFGFLHHALDLALAQPPLIVCDRDRLFLLASLIFRAHAHNAVGINLKRHLDLRSASRSGRNPRQVEFAQQVAVLGHRAFALIHLDRHNLLVVLVGRENLRLLGRDHTVAVDQLGHHTADRLNTQR